MSNSQEKLAEKMERLKELEKSLRDLDPCDLRNCDKSEGALLARIQAGNEKRKVKIFATKKEAEYWFRTMGNARGFCGYGRGDHRVELYNGLFAVRVANAYYSGYLYEETAPSPKLEAALKVAVLELVDQQYSSSAIEDIVRAIVSP